MTSAGEGVAVVVGPSGAGKDTLVSWAMGHRLAGEPILHAHRYVTRSRHLAEHHIALSASEFELRRARGLFALHWRAHRLSYGIGCEIDAWLAALCVVVINGSRAALPAILDRYPHATVVHVTAAADLRTERLRGRAREDEGDIERRLERDPGLDVPVTTTVVEVLNNGTVDAGGAALLAALRRVVASLENAGVS